MYTLTDPKRVIPILKGYDVYPLVYQYSTPTGKIQYALFSDYLHCDIHRSPFVQMPVCLRANGVLTAEGKAWLAANE